MIALKQVFFDAFKLNEHGIHILCVGYSAKSCSGSHSSLHPYHRPSLIFRPSRHPSSEGPNIFYQKYPQSSQQKKKKKKRKILSKSLFNCTGSLGEGDSHLSRSPLRMIDLFFH